jgi:hypothetical protein
MGANTMLSSFETAPKISANKGSPIRNLPFSNPTSPASFHLQRLSVDPKPLSPNISANKGSPIRNPHLFKHDFSGGPEPNANAETSVFHFFWYK